MHSQPVVGDGLDCWVERSCPLWYPRNSLIRVCVAPSTTRRLLMMLKTMTRLWTTIARIRGTRQPLWWWWSLPCCGRGMAIVVAPVCLARTIHLHRRHQSPIHLEPSVSRPFSSWEAHPNLQCVCCVFVVVVSWFLLGVVPDDWLWFVGKICEEISWTNSAWPLVSCHFRRGELGRYYYSSSSSSCSFEAQ